MKFKIGQLYKTDKYCLLVYPTFSAAVAATTLAARAHATLVSIVDEEPAQVHGGSVAHVLPAANYWSKRLNCKVRYTKTGEAFMVLEKKGQFLHVLFGNKQGWIIYYDWMYIRATSNKEKGKQHVS